MLCRVGVEAAVSVSQILLVFSSWFVTCLLLSVVQRIFDVLDSGCGFVSFCSCASLYFMYFAIPLSATCVRLLCVLGVKHPLVIVKCLSLSLIISFALKSAVFDMNRAALFFTICMIYLFA